MARKPQHRHTRRRPLALHGALGAVVMLLASIAAAPAPAATPSAVTATTVSPQAFVPDWDGHTDATSIRYALMTRSIVTVRVFDARGRSVATIDAGTKDPGAHSVAWDGRDDDGRVRAPGSYRVRVDARPLPVAPPAGQPGSASLGGQVAVAGARAAVVTLQAPLLAVRGVRLGRATLGRSKQASSTTVHFDLTTDAGISAAIVDGSSRVVRTLATRRMAAGANSIPWNGRAADGTLLPDGEYALVVAATGTGRPTATTRIPLRVDRTLPVVKASPRSKASSRSTGVTIPIAIVLDEAATVQLRLGKRVVRRELAAGTHQLVIPGSELGLAGARRARSIMVRILVTDGAGNAVARSTRVTVPAATRIVPVPERPKPPSGGGGAMAWPVAGIVTSEFGMRNGRPHQGIDIAAPSGTAIYPAGPGTVTYVGVLSGYGNLVIVDHPGGVRTYYAHMSRFGAFAVGGSVQPTDVIGYVGCTGTCSGPHVHFETRVADVPQDPRRFLATR